MNPMEHKDLSVPPPSLEVWGDLSKYEAFVQELDGWKEEAKLAAMEARPETFDAEEPLIESVYEETIRRAKESGYRAKEYFMKRLEIARFQHFGKPVDAPVGAPVIAPARAEAIEVASTPLPSTYAEDVAVMEAVPEVQTTLAEHAVEVVQPESSDPVTNERLKRFSGIAERMRMARTSGGGVSGAAPVVEARQQEVKRGFDALADFVPKRHFDDLKTPEVHVPTAPSVPASETSVPAEESTVVASAAVPESSVTPEGGVSVEERVKRSIENGGFDLAYATGPQLEALLLHPDRGIVARAQSELDARARGVVRSTKLPPTIPLGQKSDAVSEETPAEVTESPAQEENVSTVERPHAPVTREMVIATLKEGRMMPDIFMRKFIDDPEVSALLATVRASSAQGAAVQPVAEVVAGIPRIVPDAQEVEAVRAERAAETEIKTNGGSAFSEVPEPVIPRADAIIGGADIQVPEPAPVEVAPIAAPKTWEEMDLDERKDLTETCVARYRSGSEYRIRRTDGAIEQWTLMSISDEGIALFAHHTNETDQQFKRVGLMELIELNPFVDGPQTLSATDRLAILHEEEGSHDAVQEDKAPEVSGPQTLSATDRLAVLHEEEGSTADSAEGEVSEIARDAKVAEMRAAWSAMTPEEQRAFTGQCEFLFQPGRRYRISRTSGAIEYWVLGAIGTDGMVDMQSSDGKLTKHIPLRELFDLNTESAESRELLGGEAEEDLLGEELLPAFPDMPGEEARKEPTLEAVKTLETTPEAAKTPEAAPETIAPVVAESFRETFGMSREQLLSIPEFAALSEGQQFLVNRELNNFAVSQIKADALQAYRERYASIAHPLSELEQRLLRTEGVIGGLARSAVAIMQFRHKEAWQKAGMSVFKRKYIAENEKELAERFSDGTIDVRAYVQALAAEAKDGPDAIVEKGKVHLQYLKVEDLGELSPEHTEIIHAFNAAAQGFAETPHRFKEPGATEEERAQYASREAAYRDQLDQVLQILEGRGSTTDALLDVNELDRRITFTQFFHTHPEAAVQLAKIKDQQVWFAAAKDIVQTRGTLMALGGSVRTAAAAVASQVFAAGAMFVAAPLAGAATGAYMGKRRAESDLDERALLARSGVKDESGESENVVDAGARSHESGRVLAGLSGKLHALMSELEQTGDKEITVTPLVRQSPNPDGTRGEILAQAPLGETVGAEHELVGSNRALQRNKKAELLEQLQRRLDYTMQKLDQGKVNFGKTEERIQNQYTLLQAVAKAKALLAGEGYTGAPAVVTDRSTGGAYDESWRTDQRNAQERLADLLALKEQKISEAQRTYVARSTKQAALYGAGFAFAGAVVADIVHGIVTPGGSVVMREVESLRGGNQNALEGVAAGASTAEGEVARTLREGWNSPDVQKSLADPVFTKDYLRGMSEFTHRTPEVGISDTELNALLATEGNARAEAHQALIAAMRGSSTKLSDETVAKIMMEHKIPTSLEEVATRTAASAAKTATAETATGALTAYQVRSGESLSSIMRGQLPALKGLTSGEQENVIQNFLRAQTPERLQALGIGDPNKMSVGQSIDLARLNEALLAERVHGASLVDHARQLYEGTPIPKAAAVPEQVTSGGSASATAADQVQPAPKGATTPSMESTPAPKVSTGEVVGMDRPRALVVAQEYIAKDMTDPKTGQLSPLWVESRAMSAKFLLGAKESEVDATLWQKMLAIRKYTAAQGFDAAHKIVPTEQETLEEFIRRGHAERIMTDGVRGARTAPLAPAAEVVPPPAPKPVAPVAPAAPVRTAPAFEPPRLERPNANAIPQAPVAPAVPPATPVSGGYQYRSMNGGAPVAPAPAPMPPQPSAVPPAPVEAAPPSGGYQYRRLP